MGFRFSLIIAFLTLELVTTHAALSPELYWKLMLPNTPMPSAVRDLLHQEPHFAEVSPNPGGAGSNPLIYQEDESTASNDVSSNPGGAGSNPLFYHEYKSAVSHDDPNGALFFLEKELHLGTRFKVHFTKSSNAATFLPRQVAESIPFSSNRITEILNKLSKKPASLEADIMESTIKMCEKPANIGEERFCANSLESMVDLSTLMLGNKVEAISTEVEKRSLPQEYEIAAEVKKMTENKAIACHMLNYAYAIFYCHATRNTKAYMVPLVGADGTKVKAVAICHMDTSSWHPKHLAFKVLKVTPGTPICHLLPDDHIVWVPTHNQDLVESE